MALQKSHSNDKFSRKVMFPAITKNKKHLWKKFVSTAYALEKRVFAASAFKSLWVFSFQESKKTSGILWSIRVFFAFLQVRRQNILLVRDKFSFLYVGICFDLTKCKFIVKTTVLKCWLCFQLFLEKKQK